ncbi:hypothetical protein ACHAPU_011401 [Fusarium lateritium]
MNEEQTSKRRRGDQSLDHTPKRAQPNPPEDLETVMERIVRQHPQVDEALVNEIIGPSIIQINTLWTQDDQDKLQARWNGSVRKVASDTLDANSHAPLRGCTSDHAVPIEWHTVRTAENHALDDRQKHTLRNGDCPAVKVLKRHIENEQGPKLPHSLHEMHIKARKALKDSDTNPSPLSDFLYQLGEWIKKKKSPKVTDGEILSLKNGIVPFNMQDLKALEVTIDTTDPKCQVQNVYRVYKGLVDFAREPPHHRSFREWDARACKHAFRHDNIDLIESDAVSLREDVDAILELSRRSDEESRGLHARLQIIEDGRWATDEKRDLQDRLGAKEDENHSDQIDSLLL